MKATIRSSSRWLRVSLVGTLLFLGSCVSPQERVEEAKADGDLGLLFGYHIRSWSDPEYNASCEAILGFGDRAMSLALKELHGAPEQHRRRMGARILCGLVAEGHVNDEKREQIRHALELQSAKESDFACMFRVYESVVAGKAPPGCSINMFTGKPDAMLEQSLVDQCRRPCSSG